MSSRFTVNDRVNVKVGDKILVGFVNNLNFEGDKYIIRLQNPIRDHRANQTVYVCATIEQLTSVE